MSERLKSMRRVLAVQAQAKRIAEWKLATIEQRKALLDQARLALGDFMDGGELTGALAGVALKQAKRITERQAIVELDRQRQLDRTQNAQRSHKLAERVTEAVAKDERAAEARRALEALIDAFMIRPSKPG